MSRGGYGMGKRQREMDRAKKKKEKAQRRQDRRGQGPSEPEYASVEEMTGELPTIEQAMANLERRAAGEPRVSRAPCKLFVGSLSRFTTNQTLEAAFTPFGVIVEAVVITDRDTGSSRGFGFVTMGNRKDAQKAIETLDDSELDGRNIVVNVATER